jgi:hypothetical protein
MIWAEVGDIFFTKSPSLLGRLIRWAETDPGETNGTWANHTGIVVSSGWIIPPPSDVKLAEVVEALWHVKRWEWWSAHKDDVAKGQEIKVYRLVHPLNIYEHKIFIEEANAYIGNRYGWWKLLMHLADRALFRGKKVFSKLMFIDSRPICSYLAAHVYSKINVSFGMDPDAADPDEMLDHVSTSKEWERRWNI